MCATPTASFSHVGIHVRDIERMIEFYGRVLGLRVTDRGRLPLPGDPQIAFLSRDPGEHHQIALVEGRDDAAPDGGGARIVNQISFRVVSLADLRQAHAELVRQDIGPTFALNHGNAWSVYTHDPEGNMVELYVDSPWYVPQPVTDPLDLSQSDDEIRRATERAYRSRPGFQPIEHWRESFARKLAGGGSRD